jgi:hypothetical protein
LLAIFVQFTTDHPEQVSCFVSIFSEKINRRVLKKIVYLCANQMVAVQPPKFQLLLFSQFIFNNELVVFLNSKKRGCQCFWAAPF